MADPRSSAWTRRGARLGPLIGLAAAAWAGNLVHVQMAYGLDIVFGSVFSMLALKWRGTGAGVLVAAAGGAATLVLWHHPYAWLIMVAEALAVGLARDHLRLRGEVLPLAALDALYWIVLGLPLVALCYGGPLGMGTPEVLLVALKQAINGVFNAALAGALAIALQWLRRHPSEVPFRDFLFSTLVLAVLTPALAVSVWQNQRLNAAMEQEVGQLLNLALRISIAQLRTTEPPPAPAAAAATLPALTERITRLMPQVGDIRLDLIPELAAPSPPAHGARETVLRRPSGGLVVHLADRPGASRMVRWRKGHFVVESALTLAGEPVRLVAELPASRSVEALQVVQLGVFWRLGLIVLLALAGAYLLSRRISRPFAALAEAAGRLPAGLDQADPMPSAGPSRLREISDLNAAFARMEAALRQNFTALAQSEARFRAVFEQAPIGIAIVGPDRRPRFVNPALERFLGRDAATLKSLTFDAVTHPGDVAADRALFDELVTGTRDSYRLTKRYLRPDGTLVWGELYAALLPGGADGAPVPLGLVQDITDRQRAEAARAAAELALQRYSGELETFSRILTRPHPTELDFTDLLEFCRRCLGVGSALLAEVQADRYQLLAAAGEPNLALGQDVPLGDTPLPDPGCQVEPQPHQVCHPVLGMGLAFLVRTTLIWTDPEHRAHIGVLDLADRQHNPGCSAPQRQLLHLIAQRIGADLREQAVLETLLKARQREVIGHLAGGVAHDFNNVLGAVGNNLHYLTQLLAADPQASEARAVLGETQDAIGQAKVVTSGLLSLGQDDGRHAVPCDLSARVEAFAPLLRRLLPPDIELTLDLEPRVGVLVNPALLQAAMLNLALNGRDAMGARGRLTLSVSARTDPDPTPPDLGLLGAGPRAELAVRDTGVGMTAAVRRRIFEPLFSTKPRGRGTGLGLFMVREFALRSQGAIRVESIPGAGTCFRLWFPRLTASAAAGPPDTAPTLPATPPGGHTPARILVVDDDRRALNALSRLLEGIGYQVLTAVDGFDALERLAGAPDVGLVISDVAMPRMDGLALYGALCCERPQLPVVLMTGDPASTRDAAAMDPAAPVLCKPIDHGVLAGLIRTLLATDPRPPH